MNTSSMRSGASAPVRDHHHTRTQHHSAMATPTPACVPSANRHQAPSGHVAPLSLVPSCAIRWLTATGKALALCLAVLPMNELLAQTPWSLDNNFSGDGKATYPFATGSVRAYALAETGDHDIYAVGYLQDDSPESEYIAIARIAPDGSLDLSYDSDGKVLASHQTFTRAYGATVDNADKLVVTGHSGTATDNHTMLVGRFGPTGALDNTFGSAGYRTISFATNQLSRGWDLALLPDGKILAAGWSNNGDTPSEQNFAIARLTANGALDNSFSNDGKVLVDFGSGDSWAHAVCIQPDGKIVVAGTFATTSNAQFAVARLNTDGTLDNSFGTQGKKLISMPAQGLGTDAWDVLVDDQGRVVVAGTGKFPALTDSKGAVVRLNSNGDPDGSFSSDGIAGVGASVIGWGAVILHEIITMPSGCVDAYRLVSELTLDGSLGTGLEGNKRFHVFGVLEDGTSSNSTSVGVDFNGATTGDESGRAAILQAIGSPSRLTIAGYTQPDETSPFEMAVARLYTDFTIGIVEFGASEDPMSIFPNPLMELSTLAFTLRDGEQLTIALHDMQGRRVATLLEERWMPAGDHRVGIHVPPDLAAGHYIMELSSAKGHMCIQVAR